MVFINLGFLYGTAYPGTANPYNMRQYSITAFNSVNSVSAVFRLRMFERPGKRMFEFAR